jgi:hypothetical protein
MAGAFIARLPGARCGSFTINEGRAADWPFHCLFHCLSPCLSWRFPPNRIQRVVIDSMFQEFVTSFFSRLP